jgi:hypothetical protein
MLKVFSFVRFSWAPCKKMMKVGAWAQVEWHLASLDLVVSHRQKMWRILIVPLFIIIDNFYSFYTTYQPFTKWAMGCTNETW